jgi:hypothetical protein
MILSIDIGIKNLAMCIMNCTDKTDISTFNIHLWDVYNVLQSDSDNQICQALKKNKGICNKKCLYTYKTGHNELVYSCKTHIPKEYKTKAQLIKQKKVVDFLLQDIATLFIKKILDIYATHQSLFNQLTHIIIELQPKINQKMKFISHILYGKLVELFFNKPNTSIRFVRASQKLKAYTGPTLECTLKGYYAKRKWLSIQYSKWFLENKFSSEEKQKWLPLLDNTTKRDDLSDTLLMAINSLHGLPKKQTVDKNGKCIK